MTGNSSSATQLLEWFILMIKVVLVGVVVMILFSVWKFMFGFKHSEFSRVALTSSAENDLVVTSYAQVDLLFLAKRGNEILIPSPQTLNNYEQVVNKEFGSAKQYCLHSYEVTFGYPSLSAMREQQPGVDEPPVAEPDIVSINTLRSENAPDSSTGWCLRKNLKTRRDNLINELRFAMEYDEVLHDHLTHGQLVLASILDLANSECLASDKQNATANETKQTCYQDKLVTYWQRQSEKSLAGADELAAGIAANRKAFNQLVSPEQAKALTTKLHALSSQAFSLKTSAAAQQRAAARGGDVASLVLTFSSTLGISQERKRFLGLWTSKRFYLQRDIAKVYYGTQLAPTNITTSWNFLTPNRVVLEFARPDIIAIDRHASFVATRNKIEKKDNKSTQSLANYLNHQILTNLEQGIKRFHPRAVQAAESILINRAPAYFDLEDLEYEIKFRPPKRFDPNLFFNPGVLDIQPSETEPDA